MKKWTIEALREKGSKIQEVIFEGILYLATFKNDTAYLIDKETGENRKMSFEELLKLDSCFNAYGKIEP